MTLALARCGLHKRGGLAKISPCRQNGANVGTMGTLVFILQVATAVVFLVLMAIQTDKAEQSGVMGLGAQGGRMIGAVDMPVGAERILKPLTKWVGIGFLFLSALAALSGELSQATPPQHLSIFHIAGFLVVYLVVMLFGNRVWDAFFGNQR